MAKHIQREIEKLNKLILSVGAMVEDAISKALIALEARDVELANDIINGDHEIDLKEIDVEEECLKILALYQPVATDLRFVISVLKMNNDLERMGDLAANIAKRAKYLATHESIDLSLNFRDMGAQARLMVKQSLDALVSYDAVLAREVCSEDETLNGMRRTVRQRVLEEMKQHPEWSETLIQLLSVGRHLERLGDMATNLAEDIVYMVEGEIIRHNVEQERPDLKGR